MNLFFEGKMGYEQAYIKANFLDFDCINYCCLLGFQNRPSR